MSDIGKIILPKPTTEQEKDLYNALGNYLRQVHNILDKGILFSDNFDCDIVSYTSNATPDTEDTISHDLGKTPDYYIVAYQDKAASVYDGGTTWTDSNIYLKCDTASVSLKLIVF